MQAAAGEVCDDGNRQGGDGCNATCTTIETNFSCPTADRSAKLRQRSKRQRALRLRHQRRRRRLRRNCQLQVGWTSRFRASLAICAVTAPSLHRAATTATTPRLRLLRPASPWSPTLFPPAAARVRHGGVVDSNVTATNLRRRNKPRRRRSCLRDRTGYFCRTVGHCARAPDCCTQAKRRDKFDDIQGLATAARRTARRSRPTITARRPARSAFTRRWCAATAC